MSSHQAESLFGSVSGISTELCPQVWSLSLSGEVWSEDQELSGVFLVLLGVTHNAPLQDQRVSREFFWSSTLAVVAVYGISPSAHCTLGSPPL
jgi:hypothetical protein